MKKFCKHIVDSQPLKILGCGGFFEDKQIRGFYADFESNQPLTKDEARLLLSHLVLNCIQELNHDPTLFAFLNERPIDAKHISISIGFVGTDRKPYPTLSQIHLFESKVYYSTYDSHQKTYSCNQSERFELDTQTALIPPLSDIEIP